MGVALVLTASAPLNPDQLIVGEFDQADGRDYYRQIVTTVLHEGYSADVRARMLILSTSENLVGVREKGNQFEVFALRPTVDLWLYELLRDMKGGTYMPPQDSAGDLAVQARELEKSLPRDYRDVPINRCVAGVDERTGNSIVVAWARVLGRAQPSPHSDERIVLDGANFHFWVRNGREFAGRVRSPDNAWPSHQLVVVAAEMYKFCNSPTAAGAERLQRLAEDVR